MIFSDLFKIHDDPFLKNLQSQNKQLAAFRHHFRDDISIVREHSPFDDAMIDEHELLSVHGPINVASKLAAIRTDITVSEMACAEQGDPVLHNREVCFSFSRMDNSKAEFIGAFAVKRVVDLDFFMEKYAQHLTNLNPLLQFTWGFEKFVTKLGYTKWLRRKNHFYDLELLDNPINDYRNRVIVHWNAPIAWNQSNLRHPIEEIRAKGFVRDFPGYYNIILDYIELKAILQNPLGNPEWKSKLTAVTGIYMILDTFTGKQYIGSAYSKDGGIWNRWQAYANNGHGGNVMLQQLVTDSREYANRFRFSILRVMESSARARDVIEAESALKQKLGSRAFGYNLN